MKILKQPNLWTCGPTSLAMLLELSVEQVIQEIGHDGSEVLSQEFDPPACYKGFHVQELLDVCVLHRYGLVDIEARPLNQFSSHILEIFPENWEDRLVHKYMHGNSGLLLGGTSARPYGHMCAWDGKSVFNPSNGLIESLDETSLIIESFFMKVTL